MFDSTSYNHEKGQCACSVSGNSAYWFSTEGAGTKRNAPAEQSASEKILPVAHSSVDDAKLIDDQREEEAAIASLEVPSVKGGGDVMADQSILYGVADK